MSIFSQTESDSTKNIKKGWTFGALPSVAYDSDLGFQYGGLINLFYFGDGKTYPNYLHSIYLEIARTTKGGGKNQLFYDSGHIFKGKNIRLTADLSYLTEQALNFYGFNGASVNYNPNFENIDHQDYISRMFYRHERKIIRSYADFQGGIIKKKFRWLAGLAYYNYFINPVDINKLNKGKSENEKLPDTTSLYDKYIDWGIIPISDARGGEISFVKLGLIYDTRNIEANPSKGIWSEIIMLTAPSFLGNKNVFTKMAIMHRQYFNLWKNKLTFVYKADYQFTLFGNTPFYYQPMMQASYSPATINEGLGGAKSIRGILRNRIVGEDFLYGNFEFRYKFFTKVLFKQNVYVALNPFFDIGKTTRGIDLSYINMDSIDPNQNFFTRKNETLHYTYGCGIHFALNENFVVSINYGRAGSKQDGKDGLYIGSNWLF